jgi:hypothetical protein
MKDFKTLALLNRLGQDVELQVKHETIGARDYIFVAAPVTTISSLIAKNSEQFAHQLLEHFALQPERFNLIELRNRADSPLELLHWRFDWYGRIAMKSRSQTVSADRRINTLMQVLSVNDAA